MTKSPTDKWANYVKQLKYLNFQDGLAFGLIQTQPEHCSGHPQAKSLTKSIPIQNSNLFKSRQKFGSNRQVMGQIKVINSQSYLKFYTDNKMPVVESRKPRQSMHSITNKSIRKKDNTRENWQAREISHLKVQKFIAFSPRRLNY